MCAARERWIHMPTTAASIVLRESDGQVGILIDGIEGWLASGLPLEIPKTT
jgi:hypothetical protein